MIQEEGQQKLSNQIKIICQVNPNISPNTFSKIQKQCFYRYINSHDSGIQIPTQQQSKQKKCLIRQINNSIQNDQSSQFTQYTKEFYSNEFIKNFNNQNLAQKKMLSKTIKKEKRTTQSSSSQQTEMTLRNGQFTNQQLVRTMTDYLHSIKPQFLNLFSSYSDEAIMLNVKEGCQNSLETFVQQLFRKFYIAAIIKLKGKSKILSSFQNNKNKKQFKNNNEQKNRSKAQKQSEYHNFKNSLMNIITQLVCPKILDCFDLSQYEKKQLIEVILRVRENSVRFRPSKGKYYYYSNLHYNLLFLKYNDNCYESKRNFINQDLHLKVFKLDVQEFQNANFIDIVKVNRLKSIFGQIIIECLKIAENQISGNSKNKINKIQNEELESRYFYIGKVKKGIQKLLRGKKVKRF
ncbi:hypothetical protein TTHERM_00158110 (macronuclear) [Tetrahymena thermophila SB210]|uniref:Uncharacterized protein n=1 Tax=Tetrahymena thermophila (strain SB210) TaxID=312017 RepID=Q22WC3_TETTS|nr:hypothetical protein TTHERM_00158110 [Tetrahymena thermophila SB210]EAR89494.2 hypothetical protein TTHERM_00158110 [Tetrahymena thermophila SB210]|eukprot:XP_001009739.2 hypothetical protein TTHERM_00158110 [Tetrahymena thermophila SB210]